MELEHVARAQAFAPAGWALHQVTAMRRGVVAEFTTSSGLIAVIIADKEPDAIEISAMVGPVREGAEVFLRRASTKATVGKDARACLHMVIRWHYEL